MINKIRVLQIIYSFDIEGAGGGASRFGIELGQRIDPELFDSRIYALWHTEKSNEAKHIQAIEKKEIKTFIGALWQNSSPYKDFINATNAISGQFDDWYPNIIHSHSEFGDMAVLFYKIRNRTLRIIRTVHNGSTVEWPKRPLRRWLLTYLLNPIFFSGEIGVSQGITDNLNQRFIMRLRKRKALCIYNAIDFQRFQGIKSNQNKIRENLGLPADSLIIGSVGRLAPEKGFDIFIQAIPDILRVYPQAHFLIIGSGELETNLRHISESVGVTNQVRFTGQIPDIEKVLKCMDLYVSASRWEGLPTTVLESMAAGIPVVATDVSGNRELIQDQITGWLVPPDNPKELAGGILQALRSIGNGVDFTHNAQKQVGKFSIKSSVKAHENLYSKLLEPS